MRLMLVAVATAITTALAAGGGVAGSHAAETAVARDTIAPIVTIPLAPKSVLRTSRPRKPAVFGFVSDDPAAVFTCRVDNSAYEPCVSPLTVYFTAGKGMGRRHTFLVRATDLAGNSSGTAVRSVRVVRRRDGA